MMKRLAILTALLAAVVLATGPAAAQTTVGTVTGAVTDEQGGALPGATVTLTGKTGSKTATSGTDGTYRFLGVEPGTYAVQIQMSGFRSVRRDTVDVQLGKTAHVDFSMKIGGMEETLTVTGEAPVDVTSSSTETGLDQDFLFNMPISRTNAAVNLMNNLPGINNGAAYGGDANSGNALMLDGVDTRDPEGGTAWTFFNYNLVEEIQVGGLGAPAEYGAFTGAFVNTITKSGGNRYSGLFDLNYTNDKDILSESNITEEIAEANAGLADPAVTRKLLDVTAQLSGPIIRDKLFFFASAQRYELESDPAGPTTRRHEVSPRINTKVTWQPNTSNTFTGTVQYDSYNIIGRIPGGFAFVSTDDTTNREDAPEWVWLTQWRHLFGSNTFSEVKYTGWWGFFDLNPEVTRPGRFDETGRPYVSQGWYAYYDRGRHQVNASVSHFAEAFGKHDLKFGIEVERSKARNRYGYVDDINYYDYGGAPYVAYNYGYDVGGANHRESAYAQDSWKVNDRLTINAGLRFDWNRGVHDPHDGQPDAGKVWDTKGIAPRVGFAFDLTGDNRTVLKASYGQYYEGAFFSLWSSAIPGTEDFIIYDVSGCPSITAPCPVSSRQEIDRVPSTIARVDPDIKHPRRDELTIGLERAIGRDVRVSLTGIWREGRNFAGSVIPSARWTRTTATSTAVAGMPATTVPAFRWANPNQSETDILISNPDGFQYLDPSGAVLGTAEARQSYKGLMAVVTKRFSHRWQGQVSYVLSKADGTMNNDGSTTFAPGRRTFQTPTLALVNNEGRLQNDRTHELKVYTSYQIPVINVGLNPIVRVMSGRTYTPFQQFASGVINFPPSSAGRRPLLEPRGNRRLPTETFVDVRFDKFFKFGGGRDQISLYVDIQNLLNKSTHTNRQNRLPSTSVTTLVNGEPTPSTIDFDAPSQITPARQILLGARYSF